MLQVYEKVDMELPHCEGCSCHDEAQSFYNKYLHVGCVLPEIESVMAAMKTAVTVRDVEIIQLVANLQLTSKDVLWPGFDQLPPTTLGNLWKAANSLKKITPNTFTALLINNEETFANPIPEKTGTKQPLPFPLLRGSLR